MLDIINHSNAGLQSFREQLHQVNQQFLHQRDPFFNEYTRFQSNQLLSRTSGILNDYNPTPSQYNHFSLGLKGDAFYVVRGKDGLRLTKMSGYTLNQSGFVEVNNQPYYLQSRSSNGYYSNLKIDNTQSAVQHHPTSMITLGGNLDYKSPINQSITEKLTIRDDSGRKRELTFEFTFDKTKQEWFLDIKENDRSVTQQGKIQVSEKTPNGQSRTSKVQNIFLSLDSFTFSLNVYGSGLKFDSLSPGSNIKLSENSEADSLVSPDVRVDSTGKVVVSQNNRAPISTDQIALVTVNDYSKLIDNGDGTYSYLGSIEQLGQSDVDNFEVLYGYEATASQFSEEQLLLDLLKANKGYSVCAQTIKTAYELLDELLGNEQR